LVTGRLLGAGLVIPLAAVSLLVGGEKAGDKNRQQPAMAVIGVTVFHEPGLALPGAEVTLEPDPDPAAKPPTTEKAPTKVKKQKAQSDTRGELAFRVPAVPMRYTVSVKAQGYEPHRKQVAIQGEEHQDVFFTLKPTAKH
jgi:hypothetical protein